jgi:two-component system, OmpR family, alkaline phosphatase synthesis response regulator PhoP
MMTDPLSPKKILVVDDDTTVTTLLNGLLSTEGYAVLVAHDGLDAMVQVRKNVPDLIILDVMMPEINGYDVCKDLKFDERFKSIPIIIITSRPQELDPRIGLLMGIDYMQKPIDTKLLLEKIRKVLK